VLHVTAASRFLHRGRYITAEKCEWPVRACREFFGLQHEKRCESSGGHCIVLQGEKLYCWAGKLQVGVGRCVCIAMAATRITGARCGAAENHTFSSDCTTVGKTT
jgi:hypothetical protein